MFQGHRATGSPAASAAARPWRWWTASLLLAVLGLNGCYATIPVADPVPNSRIVLNLTDAGRVAYGPQIGRGISEVEGTVESASDSALVVRIMAVRPLSGPVEPWSGERFAFAPANVFNVRERRLSRSRTMMTGVTVAAGVAAAFLAVKLVGGGTDTPHREPQPGEGDR